MAYKGIAISLASLALAACGGVVPFDDAGTGDDDVDADTTVDAATEGTINVTTLTRCCTDIPGEPEPNVLVVITEPDGSVGASGRTSAAGTAQLDVTLGSTVTAIYENPTGGGGNVLISYTDIKPGDSFTFGEQFSATSTDLGAMNVSLPNLVGASYYYIYTPCGTAYIGSPNVTTSFNEYDGCHVTPMDLLFIAYDVNSAPMRWGLLPDVPFAAGGSTSLQTWQNMNTINLSLTSLPSDVTQTYLQISAKHNGRTSFGTGINGAPTNGMLSGSAAWANGGEAIQAVAQFAGPGFGYQQMLTQFPGTSTSVTIDDPTLLPWLGDIVVSPLAQQVTWIQDGDGGGGDATVLFMRWYPNTPVLWGGGGTSEHEWIIISPVGGTSRQFPALGAAGTSFIPPEDANINLNGGIVDLSEDASYDDYRARPEWEATLEDESVIATGSATISIFGFND